jgi:hypothetical protein
MIVGIGVEITNISGAAQAFPAESAWLGLGRLFAQSERTRPARGPA